MKTLKTIVLIVSVLVSVNACKQHAQPAAKAEENVNKYGLPDTIHIGKHVLQLDTSSEAAFLKLGELVFDTSEQMNLTRDSQWVKRNGDTLFFVTASGVATLTNVNADDDSYSQYSYYGKIPGTDQYLTLGLFYEWYNYFLISSKTGDTTILWGAPEVSPDKKLLITANADLEAGFTNNGLQLFGLEDGNIVSAGEKLIDEWGPEEIRWVNNNQAIAKMVFISSDGKITYRYGYVRLTIR